MNPVARPVVATPEASPERVALSPYNYAFLQQYVHKESGIVIEGDKQYLLQARLLPILKEQGIASLDLLASMLANRSSLLLSRLVIEAMTTNETLFFRDPTTFEALRTEVLPRTFERVARKRKVRIWSAAASTGQEAYSIAMLLLDMGKGAEEVEILGTDLSNRVLDRGREGKYGQFEVNRGLPAASLMKYFTRSGLDWQVNDEVRKMVRFEQMDLRHNSSALGNFDLILCRNVLIYFDAPTKTKIIDLVHKTLEAEGLLALGCAETLINVHSRFKRVTFGQAAFYLST